MYKVYRLPDGSIVVTTADIDAPVLTVLNEPVMYDENTELLDWQNGQVVIVRAGLPRAKYDKRKEFIRRAVQDLEAQFPEGVWFALIEFMANSNDSRFVIVKGIRDKIRRGLTNITNAQTVEVVNALVWENQ